jgi:aldehyde:ferredoxin oxidoreductase
MASEWSDKEFKMPYGFSGKVLRVNLSSGQIRTETPPESFYRTYMGGAAVIGYYLLKEVPTGADPLGAENTLVFAAGVLTGVPFSGGGRHSVGAKSPITGGLGKSEAGGYFGAELKFAGWDAIVVSGISDKPVYLSISDDQVVLRDATHLWGLEVYETEETIRTELGDSRVRVSSIGPGGERLVRFACIINDQRSAAGRTGMGAVMGSKRLKAVAVRGHSRVSLADPVTLQEMASTMAREIPTLSKGLRTLGTGAGLSRFNDMGNLPVCNWRDGRIEDVERISAETLKETHSVGMKSCYACAVRCKKQVSIGEPWHVRPEYGGPEYETLAGFGSNCGITNLEAICLANQICNANSLDTISASGTIAFAMECFENGILTREDTGGIDLRFGNAQAMLDALNLIVARKGIGNLLAEGSRAAARQIGQGAERLAMQVKGLEFGYHDPRLKPALGIGYALSMIGADHMIGVHDTLFVNPGRQLDYLKAFGFQDTMPANEISPNKARLFYYCYQFMMTKDCLPLCHFVPWTPAQIESLVRAVTGWDTTWYELAKVGERAVTLGRLFNAREGFLTTDDMLPGRFFEATTNGAHAGGGLDRSAWVSARNAGYGIFNWDPTTGAPNAGKAIELGLEWALEEPHS